MRRALREPLVQFVLLGAALFALHALVGERNDPASTRIAVTAGQIEHLATTFARTWQRPPTERELQGLVDDWVREEVYVREAIALGLDRDDTVIRRRLRQKMEFLTEDAAAAREPSDADLRAWLDEHADSYREDPRVAFRQVLVSRDRHGDAADAVARALLARLAAAGSSDAAGTLGDPSLLPREVPLSSQREIAREFGDGFAAAVTTGATGAWTGPIESAYGQHLVFVERREPGRLPDLDEVRERVASDWATARRRDAVEAGYRTLRDRYTVVVERAP